jgi:hypothetical protein
MDLFFRESIPIFYSFYLTTRFLIIEGNLTGGERKQTKEGEKKRGYSFQPLFFSTKWEGEAAFSPKIIDRQVPQIRVFPYCVGRYNKAVSRHPYCV